MQTQDEDCLVAQLPLPAEPVLLSLEAVSLAEAAVFALLRTNQLRDHKSHYQALRRAWVMVTDLIAVAHRNEDPDWTDAVHASEVGGTT
jgi:hypothetical protein